MLDIAWPELVVIGVVALVAIGPKDLPKAMYTVGKWAGKVRVMAHDVHRAFEQVSFEAEAAEKAKQTASPVMTPTEPIKPASEEKPPEPKHDAT